MPTAQEYETRIKKLSWSGLRKLWEAIKVRQTPGWDAGKAFEYLILRAFELDGAQVRWPYSVPLFGEEIEQIDGSVRVGGLYCIVESKDTVEDVPVAPIAKLRNQLSRRPAGTVGLLFSSGDFTSSATQLAYFTLPQAILLWRRIDVEFCLTEKSIGKFLEMKYRACVDSGTPNFDIVTRNIPWPT